jgi:hypothetical protein
MPPFDGGCKTVVELGGYLIADFCMAPNAVAEHLWRECGFLAPSGPRAYAAWWTICSKEGKRLLQYGGLLFSG